MNCQPDQLPGPMAQAYRQALLNARGRFGDPVRIDRRSSCLPECAVSAAAGTRSVIKASIASKDQPEQGGSHSLPLFVSAGGSMVLCHGPNGS